MRLANKSLKASVIKETLPSIKTVMRLIALFYLALVQ